MKTANPYLNFQGNTEEAFNFYKSVFGGEFLMVARFKDFPNAMGVAAGDGEKIAHVAIPLGAHNYLMGTDALESHGHKLNMGNNFSINIEAESPEEADRIFAGLAAGGKTPMPLQKTEWAEKYGMCEDKFGVQWMVNYTGSVEFRP